MSPSSSPYFFISYSREDASLQHKVVTELRARGINVWVDIENLIPGSPAWEREIERSIRGASGIIVLLSPDANNSEWVRREVSFTEENRRSIFPVLIRGDENDSIPLRLSSHQRVDLRHNFNKGLDELTNALKDHIGVTAVDIEKKQEKTTGSFEIKPVDLKKFAMPGLVIVIGLMCIGGLFIAGKLFKNNIPVATITATPPDINPAITETATQPVIVDVDQPTGKIIFTCSIQGDEICIINADGSGLKRLTNTSLANFNASLSPDGQKAVYIVNDGKTSEIYELDIASEKSKQLTELKKSLGSPEISPDNKFIVFHYRSGNNRAQLWIMKRDGSDPQELYSESDRDAHDGTWSPDGKQILFALGKNDSNKLYIMGFSGGDPKVVNDTIDTRGRSDWSNDLISFDQGKPNLHDVFVMNSDGTNLRQVSQGNNSQGASLSPDGKWIAFTAYTADSKQNPDSCEIFVMRVDGSDKRQLTDNSYCDYQPRWGK